MQLLLILAIILIGGKSGGQKILNEVVPVLEQMGDKDLSANLKQAVKSAEEISAYVNAFGAFSKASQSPAANHSGCSRSSCQSAPFCHSEQSEEASSSAQTCLPLKPITAIAPPDVIFALEKIV